MTDEVEVVLGSREPTLYEQVGGMVVFERLAESFYQQVSTRPSLLSLYPDPDDLRAAARHLALFLAQYWGGPSTYSTERGHPRLRMRHMPFRIDNTARDEWLACFTAALDEVSIAPRARAAILEHATNAANFLVNSSD